MKINPRYNKSVNNAIANCRKCLIENIIELLKTTTDECGDIMFNKTHVLYECKNETVSPIVFNRISYCVDNQRAFFLTTANNWSNANSSFEMSVDNLQRIYKIVYIYISNNN